MENGTWRCSVADAWQRFSAASIPKNAPKVHKREMQLAFYCGVHALLGMMQALADGADQTEGMDAVLGWEDECQAFKDEYPSRSESSQR